MIRNDVSLEKEQRKEIIAVKRKAITHTGLAVKWNAAKGIDHGRLNVSKAN